MTSSCIFCNFYVSLHLFEGFQHLLFLYIFYKQKRYYLHLELCHLLDKKSSCVSLFSLTVTNSSFRVLYRLASIQGSNVCGHFFLYVKVPFSPIPTTYIFCLLLLPQNLSKYGNDIAPASPPYFSPYTHRLRLLVGT